MEIEHLLYQLYSDPELEEKERNSKLFSDIYPLFMNKEKGSFFTNPMYVEKLTDICFNHFDSSNHPNFRVLDPACGLGEFLIAAANQILTTTLGNIVHSKTEQIVERQKIISNNLFGYDIDEKTIKLCRLRLYLWSLIPVFGDQRISLEEIKRKSADIPWNITQGNFFEKIYTKEKYNLILCNPPYNGEISSSNQQLLLKLFPGVIRNSAAYFFLLCDSMLKDGGKMGFILPKSIAYSKRWSSVKNRVMDNLIYAQDISRAFKQVKLEQVMLVVSKNSYNDKYITLSADNSRITVEKTMKLKQNSMILNLSENEYLLYKRMQSCKYTLENFINAQRGLNIQSIAQTTTEVNSNCFYCIEGKQICQFHLKPIKRVIPRERVKEYVFPGEIVGQLANAHVKYPFPHYKLAFYLRPSAKYIPFDTVIVIDPLKSDVPKELLIAYLLCYLNSKLFAWYLYKIIYAGAIRSTRLDYVYLKQVPFSHIPTNEKHLYWLFLFISKSLSYLSYRQSDPKLFDRLIAIMNCLIIRIYLSKTELDQWFESNTINWEEINTLCKELSSEVRDFMEKNPLLDLSPNDHSDRNNITKISNIITDLWNSNFSKIADTIKNEKILQQLV